jgi:hypothetical protein
METDKLGLAEHQGNCKMSHGFGFSECIFACFSLACVALAHFVFALINKQKLQRFLLCSFVNPLLL